MTDELAKELGERDTAEITDGVVTQITQAISESKEEVEFLIFGRLKKESIIPIEQACAKCDHCYFDTAKECQDFQSKDAKARGFNEVICPRQFK